MAKGSISRSFNRFAMSARDRDRQTDNGTLAQGFKNYGERRAHKRYGIKSMRDILVNSVYNFWAVMWSIVIFLANVFEQTYMIFYGFVELVCCDMCKGRDYNRKMNVRNQRPITQ